MAVVLGSYAYAIGVLRVALFVAAVAAGVIALVDWAVRTRRISPFSGVARFFRRTVDPLMLPVERTVIRAGGRPAAAPWWTLVAIVLGGLVLLFLLDFVGGLLQQLAAASARPAMFPLLLLSWVFKLLELALIVRVLASWLPISPFSRWIRWSFVLTDWIIRPLQRVIPPLGMIDITPIVAYLLLAWVLEPVVLSTFSRLVLT
ncbi:MAG TPA: YggT family protein [Gemmatimonadaceae bacterium]|nr:YggT family protein [Gemmatimonadaceae bacterium]